MGGHFRWYRPRNEMGGAMSTAWEPIATARADPDNFWTETPKAYFRAHVWGE